MVSWHVYGSDSVREVLSLGKVDPTSLPREVIEAFNQRLADRSGFACIEVKFRHPHFSKLLDCRTLEPRERDILLSSDAEIHAIGELRMLPIWLSKRVVGALFIRPDKGELTEAGVETAQLLAGEIATMAETARLRNLLRRTKNRLNLVTFQDDLSGRLGESLGGLALIWQSLSDEARRHPDAATLPKDLLGLRDAIRDGLMDLEAWAGSFASRRLEGHGLVGALKDLLSSFERVAGVFTNLQIHGSPRRIDRRVEENLYGIAFDALSTFEPRSRATTVVVSLSYMDPIEMIIRDDGVGLINRDRGGPWPGIHRSMKSIRERARSIGATVEIESAQPRGVRLVTRITTDRSVSERPFST